MREHKKTTVLINETFLYDEGCSENCPACIEQATARAIKEALRKK